MADRVVGALKPSKLQIIFKAVHTAFVYQYFFFVDFMMFTFFEFFSFVEYFYQAFLFLVSERNFV